MARRLCIGLTGGIAGGKSTVAARFQELGVPVIDADEAARAVVEVGQPGLAAVTARFGRGILNAAGEVDRRALRTLIFSNPDARRDLEHLLHPLIRAHMERLAAAALGPYVMLAIPLLVESGSRERVDRILVVDVDEEIQVQRLLARDGGTPEQARAILAAQASRAVRIAAADEVIVNNGSLAELRAAVDALHVGYLRRAAEVPAA